MFDLHPFTHRLRPVADLAPLIGAATRQKLPVQIRQIPSLGHRHQVIVPKVAGFALHTAFLVALGECAELGSKLPVRANRNEPFRFFSPVSS